MEVEKWKLNPTDWILLLYISFQNFLSFSPHWFNVFERFIQNVALRRTFYYTNTLSIPKTSHNFPFQPLTKIYFSLFNVKFLKIISISLVLSYPIWFNLFLKFTKKKNWVRWRERKKWWLWCEKNTRIEEGENAFTAYT